jgi:mannitol/fructose-specific phosphotransferase system IIA component (Ntr-type)
VSSLKPELIFLDIAASTKQTLFETLASRFAEGGYIADEKQFLDNLWQREADSPTAFGQGVAIPHSRAASVSGSPVIAFARLHSPLTDYGATPDGLPIRFVFMISVGDDITGYLFALRHIATTISTPNALTKLAKANTTDDVLAILNPGRKQAIGESI